MILGLGVLVLSTATLSLSRYPLRWLKVALGAAMAAAFALGWLREGTRNYQETKAPTMTLGALYLAKT